MSDEFTASMRDWLEEYQAAALPAEGIEQAARSTRRIGALAREKALMLPFDTDPTGFWCVFQRAAVSPKHD
jgi:hypothetical protein